MTSHRLPHRALWLAVLVGLAGCLGEPPAPVILPPFPGADDPALRERMPLLPPPPGPLLVGHQKDEFSDAWGHLSERPLSPYEITDDYKMFYAAIDSAVTWADVDSFYTDAFTRPPLAGSGFVRRAVSSENPGHHEFALWSRPGKRVGLRVDHDDLLIVLYVPPLPGSPVGAIGRMRRLDERLDGDRALW